MPRVIYIGKESRHVGKTAFQILGNLKNFGIGRMLTRHEFDIFPEPSFHIVKRAEPRMDPKLEYGTIWCETVIRGKRLPGIRPLHMSVTSNPDFRLIPKEEEEHYLKSYPITNLEDNIQILPKSYTVPPLMREYMIRRFKQIQDISADVSQYYDVTNQQVKVPFVYQNEKDAKKMDSDLFWVENRIAKDDNEKPTVKFDGKFHFNQQYKDAIDAYSKAKQLN